MRIKVLSANDDRPHGPHVGLVVAVPGRAVVSATLLDKADAKSIRVLVERGGVKGDPGTATVLHRTDEPIGAIVVLGLGDPPIAAESARRAGGAAAPQLSAQRISELIIDATTDLDWSIPAFIEGVLLGQYRFDQYKTPAKAPDPLVDRITIVCDEVHCESLKARCEESVVRCESANWARNLANTAPFDMTPRALAEAAKGLADGERVHYHRLDEGTMHDLGMNALLAVTRAAAVPARLILLEYRADDAAPTLALVGKGITFDTGGLSIKPAEHMHEMKYDMCGAAAVLGAMRVIARTRPPINVVCAVPAAENVVGSNAVKPGDIVKAFNGKTIEILNTDAEGRLVLADALSYVAKEYRPDCIVDAATLTGAAIVSLGHFAAGLLGNDDGLIKRIQAAADATDERVWPMPLWKDYADLLKGTHADLANIGPPREAGTILGGAFLNAFVGDIPWAHLDIAGTAWGVNNISYWNKDHATGYGVRLLSQWIADEAGAHKDSPA